MSATEIISIASRWVHILSVVVAIGGAIFIRFALLPSAKEVLSDDAHAQLRKNVTNRWKMVIHVCIALLIVTGGYNFFMTFQHGVKPLPYHPIFGVKLLMAFAVFFLASALNGTSPGFAKFRENAPKWLTIQITLAATIILISGVLKYIHFLAVQGGASGG
jgi:uncharacterized membrane protein